MCSMRYVARKKKEMILVNAYIVQWLMYCSSNNQVKSSMLLGQRRRRPVCRMSKVDILGRQDHRESLSTVDGALRCCGSAGTV